MLYPLGRSVETKLTDNKQSESSGLDGLKGDIIVIIFSMDTPVQLQLPVVAYNS